MSDTKNVVSLPQVNKAIKGDVYDALRKALTKPINNKSKKTWVESFISEFLDEARKNPSGPLGQLLVKQLCQEDILTSLDSATDKALARDVDFMEYRLLKQLYDKQQQVFLHSLIRKKILMCSRRVGKTTLATRMLVKECIRPNRHAVFISLKFENAIRQAFDESVRMAELIGLTYTKASKNEGLIQFSNGSSILFKGNYDARAADSSFQGDKYSLVWVDEAQSQKNLQHLLDDLITPAMSDYPDSMIVLTGTPPRIKGTYVEKIWKEFKGWKHYSWNMADNPYVCRGENTLEKIIGDICKEKGVTDDAPFIRREYFGEWFYDTEAQVFKDYKTYKGEVPLDFVPTNIAIGGDYGFSDYNSFVALAYNVNTKQAYVIDERKFNKSGVTEIVNCCREMYEKCKKFAINRNSAFDFNKIQFYCDTNEQTISHELSTVYRLPVYNCYKYNRALAIAQLSDWCKSGRVVNIDNGILTNEFEQTVYKRDESDNITSEIDDDLFHPDALDALLYASRQYAYDCGEDTGGESSDKKEKENSRAQTLPNWINGLGEEYDD